MEEYKEPPRWNERRIALLIFLCFGASIYFAYTYTGPYEWMAESELHRTGRYYPYGTFLLTCIAVTCAVFLLCVPLIRTRKSLASVHPPQDVDDSSLTFRTAFIRSIGKIWIRAFLAGVLALSFGAYYYIRARTAGNLATISLATLGDDRMPSHWVEITDAADPVYWVASADVKDPTASDGTVSDEIYFPLFSSQHGSGQPIRVFVRTTKIRFDNLKLYMGIRGMLTENGLPGAVRDAFARSAFPPAEDYFLLEPDTSPDVSLIMGKTGLGAGAGLLGCCLFYSIFYWAANRFT